MRIKFFIASILLVTTSLWVNSPIVRAQTDYGTSMCELFPELISTSASVQVSNLRSGQTVTINSTAPVQTAVSEIETINILSGDSLSITISGSAYPGDGWAYITGQIQYNNNSTDYSNRITYPYQTNTNVSDNNNLSVTVNTGPVTTGGLATITSDKCGIKAFATVYFNVAQATWDLTCSPLVAPDITLGNSSSFQLQTTPATSLNYTYTLSPSNGALPQISFSPGSNGLTTANFNTTSITTPANYTVTFTGTDSKNVSKQCATTINVSALPTATVTADIKCTYNGVTSDSSCTLPSSGGSATLTWNSTNATSCSVSVINATGTSGSQSVSPSTGQTYTLTCTNATGTASDSISVLREGTGTPPSGPNGNLSCGTANNPDNCTVSSSTGSGSTMLYWYTNNISTSASCSITRNDLATNFTVSPNGTSSGSTGVISGINTYKLICGGGVLDTLTVTVVNSPDVPSPVTAQANNNCGQVNLSWTVSSGATGYNVWQSLNQTPRNWTLVQGINSASTNSLSVNPNTQNGNTFVFAVSAFNNSAESTKAESNMITVNTCGAGSIDLSDKDVIKVTRGNAVLTNTVEPCNNNSDISQALIDYGLFQDGDIVDFQINVCNSGTQPVTGLSISDQMLNLQRVTTSPIQFSVNGRVAAVSDGTATDGGSTGGSTTSSTCARLVSDNPLQFAVDSLPAKVSGSSFPAACTITFKAKVVYQPPANNPTQKAVSGSLYRFQNLATIANQAYQKTVVTKPFLFQVTGGAPIRTEQAP